MDVMAEDHSKTGIKV